MGPVKTLSIAEAMQIVGANVKAARLARGLSQTMVEEECGVTQLMISMYERGGGNISVPTLCRLAPALGATPAMLVKPGLSKRRLSARPRRFAKEKAAKILGANLREARQAADLTQRTLAKNTRISHQTISDYEQGTKNLTMRAIVRLMRGTGSTLDTLFVGL